MGPAKRARGSERTSTEDEVVLDEETGLTRGVFKRKMEQMIRYAGSPSEFLNDYTHTPTQQDRIEDGAHERVLSCLAGRQPPQHTNDSNVTATNCALQSWAAVLNRDYAQAEEIAQRGLHAKPTDSKIVGKLYQRLATALLFQNKNVAAEIAAKEGLAHLLDDLDTIALLHENLAGALLNQGIYEFAQSVVIAGLNVYSKSPNINAQLWLTYAKILKTQGSDFREAIQSGMACNPTDPSLMKSFIEMSKDSSVAH